MCKRMARPNMTLYACGSSLQRIPTNVLRYAAAYVRTILYGATVLYCIPCLYL